MAGPRKFDHDRARELRAEGMSYAKIAARLGVNQSAVYQVLNESGRERRRKYHREYQRAYRRKPCEGGCGRLVWVHNPGRSGLCSRCWNATRAALGVRERELLCSKCGEWKPDEEFSARGGALARRGRRSECKRCETAARIANRKANLERERAYDRERKRKLRAAA